VKARGKINCGVNDGLAGFASKDANGAWDGFDVAMCRAVAAAVLGDPTAVTFTPTDPAVLQGGFAMGEFDLLARNTTWTFGNDVGSPAQFVGVNYYDGQGFMIAKARGISSARDLNGLNVCVHAGTAAELNLADYFRKNQMEYKAVPVKSNSEAQAKYLAGECDVYTTDASGLAATRATFEDPKAHLILPEIISKEPLGPVVLQGDEVWEQVVRWTLNALIAAEELGVTSANVGELAAQPSNNPEINRLLGTEGKLGEMLGLKPDWAVKVIQAGGNYGELFEKNIGENTPIGLARGLNAQWTNGGLLYALPFR
jgi:general L-amino acid transport system substrate-binding protein